MNNGQQLHGLLNNGLLRNMVQQQQREMSQQRGPQQSTPGLFDRRIGTIPTGIGLSGHAAALLQSQLGAAGIQQHQQQQHGAKASSGGMGVMQSPLPGTNLSNPMVTASSGSPQDLLLRGAAAAGKRRPEDDDISVTSSRTANSNTNNPEKVIDKEKVEAAFRSKPQPGKKRADLTEGERQELAKARNREHARQARMRKKARHEQLLHSEEMLVKMNQAEELKNKRCQNLFRFLSIRGYMLMHLKDDESASQHIANSVACMSLLGEVVADMDTFEFNSNLVPTTVASGVKEENGSIDKMREWDKMLQRRLVKKFGPGCTDTLVNYKVVNGKNGLALSADHTGFARVEIIIKVDGESKTVMSGILITHFVADSPKFEGVSWATMKEQ